MIVSAHTFNLLVSPMPILSGTCRNVGGEQGDYDGRGQQTAAPMLTAIMSGGVGISGREL